MFNWFKKFFTKQQRVTLQSEVEVYRTPITVNGKQKEIVIKQEHAMRIAIRMIRPQPLVCMIGPTAPFWGWRFNFVDKFTKPK